ncbi:MAG: DUF484 family protein [Acidiferrobacterales bacterium]|jgi:uncharacterized protein YigA (DUF484 family)|nr:DUF484 family protein [Acidiferrobacterales bacterium]
MPKKEKQAEISWEEAVSRFLSDNPEFFTTHPEILVDITVPHPQSGEAVSLIERQVGVLRDHNKQLERQLRELISNAKENEVITRRLHEFARHLLEASDIDALLKVATTQVKEAFYLDATSIRIGAHEPAEGRAPVWVEADNEQLTQLALLVAGGEPVCGSFLDESQLHFLFGDARDNIRSCALVPLKFDGIGGVYCLGSQDPHRFDQEMATDYLGRLGELIASALARHLA